MIASFDELVGKVLLVGLTHIDNKNKVLGHSEFFGRVVRANQTDGIVVLRHGIGDYSKLPPILNNYFKAKPGKYTLRSSGITIENPDYTCTWRVCTELKK